MAFDAFRTRLQTANRINAVSRKHLSEIIYKGKATMATRTE